MTFIKGRHFIELDVFVCLSFKGEVDTLKLKLARLEREKKELEEANEKLQQKVTGFTDRK